MSAFPPAPGLVASTAPRVSISKAVDSNATTDVKPKQRKSTQRKPRGASNKENQNTQKPKAKPKPEPKPKPKPKPKPTKKSQKTAPPLPEEQEESSDDGEQGQEESSEGEWHSGGDGSDGDDGDEVYKQPKPRSERTRKKAVEQPPPPPMEEQTPPPDEEKPPVKKSRVPGLAYGMVNKEDGVMLRVVATDESTFKRGGVDYLDPVEIVDTSTSASGTTFFLINQNQSGQTGWIKAANVLVP